VRRFALLLLIAGLTACTPTLNIHRLGIHDPIVSGGQAQIDQGKVVLVYPNLIAAHRTTHGGQFASLPAIQVGESFWTTGYQGNGAREWRVVKKVVTYSNSSAQLAGWPLVLQTSMPRGGRLLVFCRPA
jgi:hypothetical protein